MELSIYNNKLRRVVLSIGILGGLGISASAIGPYYMGTLLPGVADNLSIELQNYSTLFRLSIGVVGIIISSFHLLRWKTPIASFRRLGILLFGIVTYFSFENYLSPILSPLGVANTIFYYFLLLGTLLHGISTSTAILLCSLGSRA